jgi:hypothetical protein
MINNNISILIDDSNIKNLIFIENINCSLIYFLKCKIEI